jgi:hypothetical protein
VSRGKAYVTISTDPDFGGDPIWWTNQGVGNGRIKVQMDDPNFHMGTMYFVRVFNSNEDIV